VFFVEGKGLLLPPSDGNDDAAEGATLGVHFCVPASVPSSGLLLQRMADAVEQVRQRLLKTCSVLEADAVPYALIGGSAVAAWVATVDQAASRNTQNVDVLVRRTDFPRAKAAMERSGFIHRHAAGLDLFLDDASCSPRNAVRVVFAGELIMEGEQAPSPDVRESVEMGSFRLISLEALVRIKLTAFRRKDQVHLLDLLSVGLIDQSWTSRFPAALAVRLQSLLDSPDG
jgi:hypothetical protein